jgi:hypothetical protein
VKRIVVIVSVVIAIVCISPIQTNAFQQTNEVTPLSFKEFFEDAKGPIQPSRKLIGLNGKRVSLVGFMAQMEIAPLGAFYLCPRPVVCDEEGGGTADLPPESVLVIMRSQKGQTVSFIPNALEVTGILEVGAQTSTDGSISYFRLILDGSATVNGSSKQERPN